MWYYPDRRQHLKWERCGSCWKEGAKILAPRLRWDATGLYIIHQRTPDGQRVIKIGEGLIRPRLCCHRRDMTITCEAQHGPLLLTWAEMAKGRELLRVERFLTDLYRPKFGSVLIGWGYPVNLPFRKWTPYW